MCNHVPHQRLPGSSRVCQVASMRHAFWRLGAARHWYATDERLKEWPQLSAQGKERVQDTVPVLELTSAAGPVSFSLSKSSSLGKAASIHVMRGSLVVETLSCKMDPRGGMKKSIGALELQ